MKLRKQKLRETTKRYQLVITFPKFRDVPGATCHQDFDKYDEVLDAYIKYCATESHHVALVDTYRIIGIYWDQKCIRQFFVKSFPY